MVDDEAVTLGSNGEELEGTMKARKVAHSFLCVEKDEESNEGSVEALVVEWNYGENEAGYC